MALIDIREVKKSFGKINVLKGIDFQLDAGSQSVIQGASGSGKSTLLYLIGGLDRPSKGKIFVDGNDLSTLKDDELANYRNKFIGFVFQFHFLLPSMSCWDNILLPSKIGGERTKGFEKNIKDLANYLGVDHCLTKNPFELSGGEQQRVNIIRALSLRPKLLLCDEPTGSLDSENSERVIALLIGLAKEFQSTLIMVTHNGEIASQFNSVIRIQDGKIKN